MNGDSDITINVGDEYKDLGVNSEENMNKKYLDSMINNVKMLEKEQ